MPTMLAQFEREDTSTNSPAWVNVSKQLLHSYLEAKGFPVASFPEDDNLIFIGETSPAISYAAANGKNFSVILFLNDPSIAMSDLVLNKAKVLYTINHEHMFKVRAALQRRFGDHRTFELRIWPFYPKPFEPSRSTYTVGILEPDFSTADVFLHLFGALDNLVATSLYQLDVQVAFYCLSQDTYSYLEGKYSGRRIASYLLSDPDNSPMTNLSAMPNAVMSLDTQAFNPILTSWAQVIPVIKPEWTNQPMIERVASQLMNPVSTSSSRMAFELVSGFVNQVKRVEDLEVSPRFQDMLTRKALLGEAYGDYSKFRTVSVGS